MTEETAYTHSVSEVEMYPGATELILMLNFAHSHAKFFANWFKEASKTSKIGYLQRCLEQTYLQYMLNKHKE